MNEFLFLGTGAADWQIENKGDFFRRNSAALINSELMIDCGEHIFDFAESINKPNLYENVTDIIITHNHSDHFSKDSVLKLAENKKIRLGCTGEIKDITGEHPNIEYVLFNPYKEVSVGKYSVIPVLANHDVVINGESCAFHYIIKTHTGNTVFYGLDGAWFLRPSWEVMKKHRFDIMVFDCTVGDNNDWRLFEHNTIPMLRMMVEEIKKADMISNTGILVASHLARTLHGSHEETEKILKEFQVLTAYDGMKLMF